ncbi:hypothetical protein [Streptomyces rapamycinicus]|uniref:hypothetical protein n=1 Tax=Streptomyces rapamycinicus TaxID=1226757 RepID=UPI0032D909D0
MTSPIDRILARALLNPTPPIDFEAAEARLAARHAHPGGAPPQERPATGPADRRVAGARRRARTSGWRRICTPCARRSSPGPTP